MRQPQEPGELTVADRPVTLDLDDGDLDDGDLDDGDVDYEGAVAELHFTV